MFFLPSISGLTGTSKCFPDNTMTDIQGSVTFKNKDLEEEKITLVPHPFNFHQLQAGLPLRVMAKPIPK